MNSVQTFVINTRKNLVKQIEIVIYTYEGRFGHKPLKIFVNANLQVEEKEINGVAIEKHERVRPMNHVWCGDKLPEPRRVKREDDLEI